MSATKIDLPALVGRSPDQLSFTERRRYAGVWVAYELYSPQTTPLRKIAAAGGSMTECAEQLAARGEDPREYEFVPMQPPSAW